MNGVQELLIRLDLRDVFLVIPASEIGRKPLVQAGETQLQVVDRGLSEKIGDLITGLPG